MATVEIELRNYTRKNGMRPLVLRVTSGAKVSRKNTGLYIHPHEWDDSKRQVNRKHPSWQQINEALTVLVKTAEGEKAEAIKDRRLVVPSAVVRNVFATNDFYALAEARKKGFADAGKYSSQKNYASMISRLKEFAPVLAVEEITEDFLERYRAHLKKIGKKHNTIVFHLGKIAAVLNAADLKGRNPFDRVTVGTYRKAVRPALYMEDIERIKNHLPRGKWETAAKDTFLFSFFAAGMSSKDILLMRWDEITNGRIHFGRRKVEESSGIQLSIPLNPVTEAILNRYDRATKTVFNLVHLQGNDRVACKKRETVQASINRALKAISIASGVGKSIQFKDARTAFAQIANEASQRNVYGIQQAMGHSKISTTEIYLGSDSRAVDELLAKVYK